MATRNLAKTLNETGMCSEVREHEHLAHRKMRRANRKYIRDAMFDAEFADSTAEPRLREVEAIMPRYHDALCCRRTTRKSLFRVAKRWIRSQGHRPVDEVKMEIQQKFNRVGQVNNLMFSVMMDELRTERRHGDWSVEGELWKQLDPIEEWRCLMMKEGCPHTETKIIAHADGSHWLYAKKEAWHNRDRQNLPPRKAPALRHKYRDRRRWTCHPPVFHLYRKLTASEVEFFQKLPEILQNRYWLKY